MTPPNKYSDEDLVILITNKEPDSLSYLYDIYAAALHGIICRMIDKTEPTEDILKESFIKIWNKIANYDSRQERLFTWMVSITRNVTIDFIRSNSYPNKAKVVLFKNFSGVVHTTNTNGSKGVDDDATKINIRLLKDAEQAILDLAYFKGLSQLEISKRLFIPLEVVKTRMRGALLTLRT